MFGDASSRAERRHRPLHPPSRSPGHGHPSPSRRANGTASCGRADATETIRIGWSSIWDPNRFARTSRVLAVISRLDGTRHVLRTFPSCARAAVGHCVFLGWSRRRSREVATRGKTRLSRSVSGCLSQLSQRRESRRAFAGVRTSATLEGDPARHLVAFGLPQQLELRITTHELERRTAMMLLTAFTRHLLSAVKYEVAS